MESNEHSVKTTSSTGYDGVSSAVSYTVEYSSSSSAVTPSVGSVYIVETSTTDAAAQVLASSGSAVQVSVASESSTVAPTVGSVYIVETSRTNAAQVLATSGSAVQVSAASETSANSRVSQIARDLMSMSVSIETVEAGVSLHGNSSSSHLSVENSILSANNPLEFNETESLTVHGNTAGVTLAAEFVPPSLIDLEGDVEALRLIDLDQEGLAEYRAYLAKFSSQTQISSSNVVISSSSGASVNSAVSARDLLNAIIMELFQSVDTNLSGQISRGEAESLLLRLNIRLGRSYTQADATAFVQVLDVNGDGVISFEEFRSALLKNFA
jgi:hypothetical protein